MLETNRPRLKVSRAGIVLIKSFESFRPRAVQRDDGRWVIGYGHTASAREGLTVGEQDAELLLQYDLIPVAKALNDEVRPELNQHQFDALASFAVSVGVDRFLTSDVMTRINAGQAGEAADALIGWPETVAADAALRRRAAERALFVADPASPVLLSDLLAAPLPPPTVAEPAPVAEPEAPVAEPALTRAAAVASLLGEPHAPEVEPGPEPETEAEAVVESPPEPVPAIEPESVEAVAEPEPEPVAEPAPRALPLPSVWGPQVTPASGSRVEGPSAAFFQRYSPYSAAIIGPLPGFPSAVTPPPVAPAVEPSSEAATDASAIETFEIETPPEPVAVEPTTEPQPEPQAIETAPLPTPETEVEPALTVPTPVVDEQPVEMPVFAPVTPLTSQPPVASPFPSDFPPLELTPAVEADFAEPAREAWTPEERTAVEGMEETVLFDEEPPLAVLRHEVEPAEPRRFWVEAGPYMIMGGLGLFSCAASAAAFRKATSDALPTNEFTVIAWVLALIGAVCVSVSAWNLYARAGKRN